MNEPPAWAYLAYGIFFLVAFLAATIITIMDGRR